jgi:hypothetical protein
MGGKATFTALVELILKIHQFDLKPVKDREIRKKQG